jgi:hypothetical protein
MREIALPQLIWWNGVFAQRDLPTYAEYLYRGAFDIAEKYGKDTFLTICYLGFLPQRLFRPNGSS